MAEIAELFGQQPEHLGTEFAEVLSRRHCPFTNRRCDVSANRGDRAFLSMDHAGVSSRDKPQILKQYGKADIPLGICSLATKRRYEAGAKPWIICPKRMMDLRDTPPVILPEVRAAIPIRSGTTVRCWWEFKFASADLGDTEDGSVDGRFFEYTFDYILLPVKHTKGQVHPQLLGPPYIIEIMTSSTRGGGLTEHMSDVLLGRPQRSLRGHVDSPYTPNYRQVFGRMVSQFFAKSEVAEAWGGRTIWVMQDVLMQYIEQTTAFKASQFNSGDTGNAFAVVYKLQQDGTKLALRYDRTLRGSARNRAGPSDFTSMLGIGYVPPLDLLLTTLTRTQNRRLPPGKRPNWVDFVW